MAQRILVPVLPSERFYDAVVAAGDMVAEQGGLITFLFTGVRAPPRVQEAQESNTESEIDVSPVPDDADPELLESWQAEMVHGLDDARDLLYERGIEDDQLNYAFGAGEETPAQIIADEAAAGAYDLVILARGYFIQLPDLAGGDGRDLAEAVLDLADDGVRLLVT